MRWWFIVYTRTREFQNKEYLFQLFPFCVQINIALHFFQGRYYTMHVRVRNSGIECYNVWGNILLYLCQYFFYILSFRVHLSLSLTLPGTEMPLAFSLYCKLADQILALRIHYSRYQTVSWNLSLGFLFKWGEKGKSLRNRFKNCWYQFCLLLFRAQHYKIPVIYFEELYSTLPQTMNMTGNVRTASWTLRTSEFVHLTVTISYKE